jgi:hypothetical protein
MLRRFAAVNADQPDRFQKKWSPFGGKTASLFSGPLTSSESGLNS